MPSNSEPQPVAPPHVPVAQLPTAPGPMLTKPGPAGYMALVVAAAKTDAQGPSTAISLPQNDVLSSPRGPMRFSESALNVSLALLRALECVSSSLFLNSERNGRVVVRCAVVSLVCTAGCDETCADSAAGGMGTLLALEAACHPSRTELHIRLAGVW